MFGVFYVALLLIELMSLLTSPRPPFLDLPRQPAICLFCFYGITISNLYIRKLHSVYEILQLTLDQIYLHNH